MKTFHGITALIGIMAIIMVFISLLAMIWNYNPILLKMCATGLIVTFVCFKIIEGTDEDEAKRTFKDRVNEHKSKHN